ncbi:MAG TPA: hypothetical protein VLB29_05320 [Nocardioidaceae bacterium]|nr:hypothetical protein [Nocardioidaceae bacterium]
MAYLTALALGLAAGVAVIAVHRTLLGFVLAAVTTLVVLWTLRQWLPRAATAFAAGWLLPLLVAISGRSEGDYAVSSDLHGWMLIIFGFVVLITGISWGRPMPGRSDSG